MPKCEVHIHTKGSFFHRCYQTQINMKAVTHYTCSSIFPIPYMQLIFVGDTVTKWQGSISYNTWGSRMLVRGHRSCFLFSISSHHSLNLLCLAHTRRPDILLSLSRLRNLLVMYCALETNCCSDIIRSIAELVWTLPWPVYLLQISVRMESRKI